MNLRYIVTLSLGMLLAVSLSHDAYTASYTWNLSGGGTWDTSTSNWTPSGTPGSADDVTFGDNNSGADRTIIYGANAPSTINSLDLDSLTGYKNILRISKANNATFQITSNTTIGSGAYLWLDPSGGKAGTTDTTDAGTSGIYQILKIGSSGTGTLTIDTGGTFEFGVYSRYYSADAGVTWKTGITSTQVTGNVEVNSGGLLKLSLLLGGDVAGHYANLTSSPTITGDLTLKTGGEIDIERTGSVRLQVNGDFTAEDGSSIKATTVYSPSDSTKLLNWSYNSSTGATSSADSNGAIMNLRGDVTIGNNVTIDASSTTLMDVSGTNRTFNLGGVTIYLIGYDQTVSSGSYIPSLMARSGVSYNAGTGGGNNTTKTISSSLASGNQIGSLSYSVAWEGAWNKIMLASDLRVNQISFSNGSSSTTDAHAQTSYTGAVLDVAGYTLTDVTTLEPRSTSNTSQGVTSWYFTNSSAADGTISAPNFNFNTTSVTYKAQSVNVGYDAPTTITSTVSWGAESTGTVILKSTGTSTNDLGGEGKINPHSVFWYTGSDSNTTNTGYLKSTASASYANGRAVGKVMVGDTSMSKTATLMLSSTIQANGGLQINTGSRLNLNGNNFVVGKDDSNVGGSFLTGAGNTYLDNNTTTNSTLSFDTSATTMGKFSPGGDGTIGYLNVATTNTGSLTLDLTNTNVFFDVASLNNYDFVTFSKSSSISNPGAAMVKFAGSTIYLNFTGTTDLSGTIQLFFDLDGLTSDGVMPTFTSNWTLEEYTFDLSTGNLTFVALIPEPSTILLFVLGGAVVLIYGVKKYKHQKAV